MKQFTYTCALLLVFLSGCASTPEHKAPMEGHFYAGVGAGYKIDADYGFLEEHEGGRNPTANFALGHEWTFNKYDSARCEYAHWSHWRDGGPFNDRPETHKDEAICWYFRRFWFWQGRY